MEFKASVGYRITCPKDRKTSYKIRAGEKALLVKCCLHKREFRAQQRCKRLTMKVCAVLALGKQDQEDPGSSWAPSLGHQ